MSEKNANFTIIASMMPCVVRRERVNIAIISLSKRDLKAHLVYGKEYSERINVIFRENLEDLYFSCIESLKKEVQFFNQFIEKHGISALLEQVSYRAERGLDNTLQIDEYQVSIKGDYSSESMYLEYCDYTNQIEVWGK